LVDNSELTPYILVNTKLTVLVNLPDGNTSGFCGIYRLTSC